MSKETIDTLGNQKKTNYALNPTLSKEEFISAILSGLVPPPGYFPQNVLMNIKGYESFDKVLSRSLKALTAKEFEALANQEDVLMLDTRDANAFAKAYIPNSINIGIDGSFASWLGTLVPDVKQKILIIAEEGREEEVVTRMARVGYDYALGFLKGGINEWISAGFETDSVNTVEPDKFAELSQTASLNIIDVRKASEFNSEHIIGAINAPLDFINDHMSMFNTKTKYYIHCAGGYRSMTFISIMQSRGYRNFINVNGGFSALKKTGSLKLSEYVCPTTQL